MSISPAKKQTGFGGYIYDQTNSGVAIAVSMLAVRLSAPSVGHGRDAGDQGASTATQLDHSCP